MTLNTSDSESLVFNHDGQTRISSLEEVKTGTDLLAMVRQDTCLKQECAHEWSGQCPFCQGHDRFSVSLKRHKWFCRGCGGGYWHDAIDYVARRDRVSTGEAIKILKGGQSSVKVSAPKTEIDRVKWLSSGMRFIENCHHTLYSKEGNRALEYLQNRRGLTDQTIKAWRLGYNAVNRSGKALDWGTKDKVWLARGIVIPCLPDRIRSIKIRRSKNDLIHGSKYVQVRGSRSWLFGAETFVNCFQAFIFEGEFDALLAWQEWGGVGLGIGAFPAGMNFSLEWLKYVVGIERFYVAHDMDRAGRESATKLAEFSDRMTPVSFPMGNDLGEYYEQGGNVFEWIYDSLGSEND